MQSFRCSLTLLGFLAAVALAPDAGYAAHTGGDPQAFAKYHTATNLGNDNFTTVLSKLEPGTPALIEFFASWWVTSCIDSCSALLSDVCMTPPATQLGLSMLKMARNFTTWAVSTMGFFALKTASHG